MEFLELQKQLWRTIRDRRAEWNPDEAGDDTKGDSLKAAINHGVEQLYKRLMNNSHYKDQNYTEVTLTPVDGKVSLPSDFGTEYEMLLSGQDFYDYRLDKKLSKIVFDNSSFSQSVTFRYIAKYNTLTATDDIPNLEDHFHEAIPLYAMEKYHLDQTDWDNVSRSVAYAEDKVEDLILKYF